MGYHWYKGFPTKDDGETREEWEAENRSNTIAIISLLVISIAGGLLTSVLFEGNNLGRFKSNSKLEREVAHKMLPEELQFYDTNRNGVLESGESYHLFIDYNFTKKPPINPPITTFN